MSDDVNNGLVFVNKYFMPPEILSVILSDVDVETLSKHCNLVCKLWNDIIKESVWKLKCKKQLNKHQLQSLQQQQYTYNVYQMICVFKKAFYTNLIKNACGSDAFNHWIIEKNGGDRFIIEDITLLDINFCKINDEMISNDLSKCFTTSYGQCSKLQMIDLLHNCVSQKFLDEYQPPIYVSEWYGSRHDCGCTYQLRVILFDNNFQPIRRCNCNFVFYYEVEQWQGGFFQKIEYVFKNYGVNVRYILFYHIGKDTQFWAGHYGSKFTHANVQLFYPNDTSKDHVIDVQSQQSYHEACQNDNDNCQSPIYKFDRSLSAAVQTYAKKYLKSK